VTLLLRRCHRVFPAHADVSGAKPRFRLLDTTRTYAIKKLDESGQRERIARRHAEYYRNVFERAEAE
jgi:predicted ATPase